MIGNILGDWRLTAQIGQGGTAVVYLAEHVVIGNRAAVKVLLPTYTGNQDMIQRFLDEARATAAVKHPGIIQVFDFGEMRDGCVYLVMEFLAGETLHKRLKREGQLPLDQALQITRQITSALHAAHEAGIVHRDLKPDNIFLVPDPEVLGGERAKILDFGIAKLSMSEFSADRRVTKTGVINGTPDYMSPEQCKGERDIDHRADLYSLGCILFKLLTGRTPFAEHATGEVLSCHVLKEPPRPESLVSSIPPNVGALVMRLLEKEPENRFFDAAELQSVLARMGSASGHGAPLGRVHTQPSEVGHSGAQAEAAPQYPINDSGYYPDSGSATPVSTLSSAAHYHTVALPDVPPAKSRQIARYGLGLAAAVVLFGAAAFSTVQVLQAEVAPLQAEEGSPMGAAAQASPSPEAPEIAPATKPQIEITISSSPTGAEIYQMPRGALVGRTPTKLSLGKFDGQYVFLLKHAGHGEFRLEAAAQKGDAYHAELPRLAGARETRASSNKKRDKSKQRGQKSPHKSSKSKMPGDNHDDVGLMDID